MKNFILLFLTAFITYMRFANEFIFTPTKNQKVVGIFSGDIDQKESIRL